MGNSGMWTSVKGGAGVDPSTIRVRDEFVLHEFGAEAQSRVRAAVSPPLRALLGAGDLPPGYVDFGLFVEMNLVIDRQLGSGDLSLVPRMGRYAAHHNAGVWRSMFAKGVDVPTFMGIASGLWHKHYDSGALGQTLIDDHTVDIEIRNFALPHRTHCLSVVGWLQGIFELDPDNTVTITEQQCRATREPRCVMKLCWEPTAKAPT